MEYERLSVLYNLAAVYNNLVRLLLIQGISYYKSDKKTASKQFATASWILSKLIRVSQSL